jgi:hypothetical protein
VNSAGNLDTCQILEVALIPNCRYDSSRVLVPLYRSRPLMVLGDREVSDGSEEYTIPGLNLFTVFMNNDLTYEDGIAMSLSAANKFQYLCVKQVPIRNGPDVPVKGTKVSPMSKSWWQVPFEGTVVSSKFVSRDLTRLSVSFVGSPVNGDKFTTFHGQKGVVTIVTDDSC